MKLDLFKTVENYGKEKRMKRFLTAVLTAALLLSLGITGAGAESEDRMTSALVPVYYAGNYGEESGEIQVYYRDGNTQIPYFDLDTVTEVMNKIYRDGYGDYEKDPNYTLTYEAEGSTVGFLRENGYNMDLDFDADTVYFYDYDMFVSHSFDATILELGHSSEFDEEGSGVYLQRCVDQSFSVYGKELMVDLSDYSIDLIREGENYYIPAQTMADLLIGETYTIYLYNGEACFFLNYATYLEDLNSIDEGYSALFYAPGPRSRSEELIEFTYNELCLNLDLCYGFKDSRGISCFDDYFEMVAYGGKNLKKLLLSEDPEEMDLAVYYLTRCAFDDLHSSYHAASSYTGADKRAELYEIPSGAANRQFSALRTEYKEARAQAFPDGVPGYQEIGNTAYITFDNFIANNDNTYYTNPPTDDTSPDNMGLLIYANSRIRRENSPIENVVIDLSCNTGGEENAVAYDTAWFLGEANIYLSSSLTGAAAVNVYRCDTNLDHEFTEEDTVADLNLYCLISPVSFSCGNLMPTMLKASGGRVILVGQTTGGGSCVVRPFTTASGTFARCSGYKHVSTMKNGSYYDADQGVQPDVVLTKVESFYDREALTDYLNALK